jgi:integrase
MSSILVQRYEFMESKLTDKNVKGARPGAVIGDGGGLWLVVKASGTRSWIYRYTDPITKRVRKLGLGPYPTISLEAARRKAREQRALVVDGKDPIFEKKVKEEAEALQTSVLFRDAAEAWFQRERKMACNRRGWSEQTCKANRLWLDLHILPWLGDTPIGRVTKADIVAVLRRCEKYQDTPGRVRRVIGKVFDYACHDRGLPDEKNLVRQSSNLGDLRGWQTRHHAAIIEPGQVGKLMRDVSAYTGSVFTCAALKCSAYLAQRPGEIHRMRWECLDLDGALWTIPAAFMKMRVEHKVPLPRQVVQTLCDLQRITGATSGPVFPNMSRRKGERASEYMSAETVNKALRLMGYDTKTQHSAHGFRATAETLIIDKLGLPKVWIERHEARMPQKIRDEVSIGGAVYDRATYLEQRYGMIQQYADLLDDYREHEGPGAPHPRVSLRVVKAA